MKSTNKIDTKKIGTFLKSLGNAEFKYLLHCANIRDQIEHLIEEHKLTKKEACKMFNISHRAYSNFVKGNRNYDMEDMARLNAVFVELTNRKTSEKVPVKFSSEVIHDVSDSICLNCDGWGYTVDENGRRKEHCDKC